MGKGGRLPGAVAAATPETTKDGTHVWREEAGKQVWCVKDVVSKRIKTGLPRYSRAQVAKHNTKEDCWIIIHNFVYDISKWIDSHPGGYLPLVNVAGGDATDNFLSYHPVYVWERKLPYFQVGQLTEEDSKVSKFVGEYRNLQQQFLEAGMYQTRMGYYVKLFAWVATLFAAMLYLSVVCTSTTAHMCGAVMLGFFFQQIAFIGHDLGHNGVTHVNRIDSTLGLLFGNILTGISMGWWKWSHNTHHNVCNSVQHDPDVQYIPIFAPGAEFLESDFKSTFHQRVFSIDAVARTLIKYQHILFYPVMGVARFNLYVQSILFIIKTKVPTVNKPLEWGGLAIFYTWLTTLLWQLPTVQQSIAFLLLSHATAAILHVQIVLSHFPMTKFHGYPMQGTNADSWFVLQVATSLDITNPWWMEWFHGGLQYQVEHHLFPRIPRHNLVYVRPVVKAFCEKHGIKYTSMSFWEANVALVQRLYDSAVTASTIDPAALSAKGVSDGTTSTAVEAFTRTTLWDGFNAVG